MDILIKGIKKLPQDGDYIHLIIQNGKVHTAISCGYLTTDKLNVGTVVALPPHGKLVNLDDVYEAIEREIVPKGIFLSDFYKAFADIPVVLEAST